MTEIPTTVTIGINGHVHQAFDLWRQATGEPSGRYIIPGKISQGAAMSRISYLDLEGPGEQPRKKVPLTLTREIENGETKLVSVTFDFRKVPCPPNCESTIFKTRCLACFEFGGFSVEFDV